MEGVIEEALERGRQAASRKRGKQRWEPEGLELRGWLVAHVRDLQSGKVESVYEFRGKLLFYDLGRKSDGSIVVYPVRDRSLRRVAQTMLHGPDRDDLIRALHEERKDKLAEREPATKTRRKQ